MLTTIDDIIKNEDKYEINSLRIHISFLIETIKTKNTSLFENRIVSNIIFEDIEQHVAKLNALYVVLRKKLSREKRARNENVESSSEDHRDKRVSDNSFSLAGNSLSHATASNSIDNDESACKNDADSLGKRSPYSKLGLTLENAGGLKIACS